MARKTPKRELRRTKEEGYRGHSDSYRYIRTNLDRFTGIGVGTKDGPSWEVFAAMLAREGQKNAQGGPLSWDSARRIFERASKDAEAKKAETQAVALHPRSHPSRLPATWRPQEAPPPPATAPRPLLAQPSSDGSGIINNDNCTPEEALAGLRRILAERSGR